MNTGIYAITAPSGSQYIGSAIDFNRRWRQHRHDLRRGRHHNQPLQRAVKKYGIEKIRFSKILICRTEDLLFFEQRVIDAFCPAYNACKIAGSSLGLRRSEEANRKNAEAHRGKKASIETRRRMSLSQSGHKTSKETRAKIAVSNAGKKRANCFEETVSLSVKDEIVRKYLAGLHLNPLASEYHADRRAVRRIIEAAGIRIRRRGERAKP